jgi:preprotein translocase subunit YajC
LSYAPQGVPTARQALELFLAMLVFVAVTWVLITYVEKRIEEKEKETEEELKELKDEGRVY